jgi:hypothetical protein
MLLVPSGHDFVVAAKGVIRQRADECFRHLSALRPDESYGDEAIAVDEDPDLPSEA